MYFRLGSIEIDGTILSDYKDHHAHGTPLIAFALLQAHLRRIPCFDKTLVITKKYEETLKLETLDAGYH